MKRIVVVLGAVAAVLAGAFALVWFVAGVADRIVQSGMTRQMAKAARAPYLSDDALHILLCGTGSPMPDMTRANACAAVIANGHVVVIDAGPGAWSRLAAANIPGAKIDTVLLTHLHSDHIGDLGEVATQSWLGGRKVPLEVYGPPAPQASERTTDAEGETFGMSGTEEVVKGFAQAYNSDAEFRIAQGHELVPTEAARMIGHDVARPGPEEAVTVYDRDGLKISAFLVNHDPVEPAYGYRIEYGGRAAVVSGDTARVQNMVRFAKGADVLVHEALSRDMVEMLASALDASGNSRAGTMARQIIAYHTSPVEASSIAKEAAVPLLVFTHEVPPLRNALMRHMFLRGVADARGPGDTILGRDGLLISLPKGSKDIKTKNLW
ncbi:MBL fold metallo-hydrolase [Methyloceanibacter sp.]|uniref:MBL fold metallo-hydrolase n=1 Tax=Methyloceanibacter sp. TaxID=1965321 RepID=UPI003D6DA7E0